jgi:hypothetical protein
VEHIAIITGSRPTEYTGLGNLGFLWVVGAVLLVGFIACWCIGANIGKNWNNGEPPLIKKIIDSAVKNSTPKLKDPSHYMKGKK